MREAKGETGLREEREGEIRHVKGERKGIKGEDRDLIGLTRPPSDCVCSFLCCLLLSWSLHLHSASLSLSCPDTGNGKFRQRVAFVWKRECEREWIWRRNERERSYHRENQTAHRQNRGNRFHILQRLLFTVVKRHTCSATRTRMHFSARSTTVISLCIVFLISSHNTSVLLLSRKLHPHPLAPETFFPFGLGLLLRSPLKPRPERYKVPDQQQKPSKGGKSSSSSSLNLYLPNLFVEESLRWIRHTTTTTTASSATTSTQLLPDQRRRNPGENVTVDRPRKEEKLSVRERVCPHLRLHVRFPTLFPPQLL